MPVPFLRAAGLLVVSTIVLVAAVQLFGSDDAANPLAGATVVKEFRFVDEPGGAIAVYAEPGGQRVETLAPETHNFLRGILRALVRERRQNSIGDAVPFRVFRSADGALFVEDPATARRIHLNAFGPVNAVAFAELLEVGSKPR